MIIYNVCGAYYMALIRSNVGTDKKCIIKGNTRDEVIEKALQEIIK